MGSRSWMHDAPRSSEQFVNGVESFLNFAFVKSSGDGKILCPCRKCYNMFFRTRGEVYDHLICYGFRNEYTQWVDHGELRMLDSSTPMHINEEIEFGHDMHGLLHDIFPPLHAGESSPNLEEQAGRMGGGEFNNLSNEEIRDFRFSDLIKDAERDVYPNSKYSKLACLVHLFHIKCLNGWSNKSFSMLLEFLQDLLPNQNLIPKTTSQVKRELANLGLGYEKIHVCPNDCMLFWDEKEKDENCSICGASRWKSSIDNMGDEVSTKKKKATKILRWFPLKPRLQRLFISSKTASLMKWHHEDRIVDGKLRHPADARAWKDFDQKFPGFSNDPRNIRMALASDGFNPFKTMNVAYSIWPVFLIPYNLPPWMVMKKTNFILSLIIPGPRGPGNKIDVYMQPLIKELKELWELGIETFDACTKENFQLKAAVISTISDFPGYANLSGWSTKGELACPLCGFDTASKWLEHGRKFCYMCHRRWLPSDHRWRNESRTFDGDKELRNAPTPISGNVALQQVKEIEFMSFNVANGPWKKRSIFFMLPYWEGLLLRHNLDVMHIEKNVCDNVVGTLLGQEGKTKDNYKARLDLQKIGLRKELHPKKRHGSNKTYLPQACYQMTRAEKDAFLKTLKFIKPPDEFSSNISRCVQLKERKLIGLKSYDCHMLMQEYLPIALRGTLPENVASIVIELCDLFKGICCKDLCEADLKFLESRAVTTLCKMEKIFPPSFFTIMVHLVIHLVEEVRLGGPVTFRWMYSVERELLTLKSYVHNRAHPEGSIAEGYLAQESLTFCSRYLSGVETLFTRPIRNDDDGDQNEIEETNSLSPGRPLGRHMRSNFSDRKWKRANSYVLDEKSAMQAHRYVLFNVDSIIHFREEHKSVIKNKNRSRRQPEYEIERIHCQQFSDWFRKRVSQLQEQGDERITDEIRWLAFGPNRSVERYSGYLVKGYRFHTKEREKSLKTQNSGIVVTVKGESYASSRDRRPIQGVVNYYGSLEDIIELNYSGKLRVVLFKCQWVDINRGVKRDDMGLTLVNFTYSAHTGANLLDDPFVLASQVDKVFYAKDSKSKDWLVVRHVKVRDTFDMGGNVDQIIHSSNDLCSDIADLHRVDLQDGDNGVDVTPLMEDYEDDED